MDSEVPAAWRPPAGATSHAGEGERSPSRVRPSRPRQSLGAAEGKERVQELGQAGRDPFAGETRAKARRPPPDIKATIRGESCDYCSDLPGAPHKWSSRAAISSGSSAGAVCERASGGPLSLFLGLRPEEDRRSVVGASSARSIIFRREHEDSGGSSLLCSLLP